MTTSTKTVGPDRSPMLIVPAAGFAEIVSPFWRDEKMLRRAQVDWERRWQAEWDRRNVED